MEILRENLAELETRDSESSSCPGAICLQVSCCPTNICPSSMICT